ncbi:MAG TPA: heavy metal-associated domain-containing protein [Bryobacteraceae bacterium]|jgi:copper chaperone CopZ|nr:heavy metal-associated domain-containing protein [Bryobacteraceae bacterium]
MKISIEGMHCQACVRRVEKALASLDAAKVESVEIGSASVSTDPSREQAVLEAIREAGYQARKAG